HGPQIEKCEQATPGDQKVIDACIAAITRTEYMVEPGNPALSPLMRHARPDELMSVSPVGLKWHGTKHDSRFGARGDRRMQASNHSADTADDVAGAAWYD